MFAISKSDHDLIGAEHDYEKASWLGSKNYMAFFYEAGFYMYLNKTEAALSDLDRSISLNPVYPPAHVYRGLLFEKKRDIKEAIEEYNEAIRLDSL